MVEREKSKSCMRKVGVFGGRAGWVSSLFLELGPKEGAGPNFKVRGPEVVADRLISLGSQDGLLPIFSDTGLILGMDLVIPSGCYCRQFFVGLWAWCFAPAPKLNFFQHVERAAGGGRHVTMPSSGGLLEWGTHYQT